MKRLLFSFFLVLPMLTHAQSNFRAGYVITNTIDTLKGYINYKERVQNPTSVQFRAELNGKTQLFDPGNCAGYGINGLETFNRFVVQVSESKTDIANLSIGPDSSSRTDTVFLKVLQSGKNVSLYLYRDKMKTRFYLKKNDSDIPQELDYQVFLDPKHDNRIVTAGRFAGQLSDAMVQYNTGSMAYRERLRTLKYEQSDLSKIVAWINGQELQKARYARARFFAGAGASISQVTYQGDHYLSGYTLNNQSYLSPVITTGADLFLNPAIGKLIFRTELSFMMAKSDISTIDQQQRLPTYRNTFDQYTAVIVPQVIYNVYNTNPLKIFLGAGFGINLSKYTNVRSTRYNLVLDQTFVTEKNIEMPVFYASIPLRIGAVISKKIELSAIYTPPASITDYIGYSIQIQRFSFGLNYLFGK